MSADLLTCSEMLPVIPLSAKLKVYRQIYKHEIKTMHVRNCALSGNGEKMEECGRQEIALREKQAALTPCVPSCPHAVMLCVRKAGFPKQMSLAH